ncbi:MAG: SPASM domain-containing protein [Nanoarchaeota archaeon]|jgi:uncharacterized protein|nr:SPASM domain-containing protein [Nanoarchaeota archaeon]
MRFSKFAHIYECIYADESYYLIRHSLTNKLFFFNEAEFKKLISSLKNKEETKETKELSNHHFLVPNAYKEKKFAEFIKEKYNLNKFELEIIYLIFNTDCNMKCKYCYVEGSKEKSFSHQSMDEETFNSLMEYLKKLIEYQKKKNPNKEKLVFIYYGSEPLMSKDLLARSLSEISKVCSKNKIVPDFQLITNGTLLDENIVKEIKKFKVGVSISLDGNEAVNDAMRIYKDNQGTYKDIISAINLLDSFEVPFGISCTIGPHNIDILKENVEEFIKINTKSIGFNILLNSRYEKNFSMSLNKINDKLIEASSLANQKGYYEDRVQRKVRAFNGRTRFKDCGGVGNQLVFFPNGDISTCEAYLCNRESKVGNIKNTDISEIEKNKVVDYWTKRYPLNMEECLLCPSIGVCGGGCPFNAETISKNGIYERDKPFCVHTDKILSWLLKKSVEEEIGQKDPYIRDISYMYSQNFP